MSRLTGFSEKSFFSKKKLKYGQKVWAVDPIGIALNFLKELDTTDCSMQVLEKLEF